jgi:hypothetical protein
MAEVHPTPRPSYTTLPDATHQADDVADLTSNDGTQRDGSDSR